MVLGRFVPAWWTPRHMRIAVAALFFGCVAAFWTSVFPHAAVVPRQLESVLHRSAAKLSPLAPGKRVDVHHEYGLDAGTFTITTTFPLHGQLNAGVVHTPAVQEADATLLVVVLTDRSSWGPNRSVASLFAMLANATIPTTSLSLTLLTSNMDEFRAVKEALYDRISDYAQISLLFRNDFRPAISSKAARYRMLARYRNFALLSTLEVWHQHVVYMDADVYAMPTDLLMKLVRADRDIIAPLCVQSANPVVVSSTRFDGNAYIAHHTPRQWRAFASGEPQSVRYPLWRFRDMAAHEWIPLDSVGAKFLYVKADVHRQGVTFPLLSARGTYQETADGVEASGLCAAAHVVGYTCWGLPHEHVFHQYSDIERWR
jgi:hypothetical protein